MCFHIQRCGSIGGCCLCRERCVYVAELRSHEKHSGGRFANGGCWRERPRVRVPLAVSGVECHSWRRWCRARGVESFAATSGIESVVFSATRTSASASASADDGPRATIWRTTRGKLAGGGYRGGADCECIHRRRHRCVVGAIRTQESGAASGATTRCGGGEDGEDERQGVKAQIHHHICSFA